MTAHVDILDARESLRKPLLLSVALHGSLVVAIAVAGFAGNRPREHVGQSEFAGRRQRGDHAGEPDPAARARRTGESAGERHRVARAGAAALEAAVAAAGRAGSQPPSRSSRKSQPKRPARTDSTTQRSNLKSPESPNQLYSSTGQALSSPLVGQTGSGGVGMGQGGAFGNRFGAYTGSSGAEVGEVAHR